jgi:hypothetical protein
VIALRAALRRLLLSPLWLLVAAYLVLSDLVAPALRPAIRVLARLRPIRRLQTWLAGLRPSAALLVLGLPAALIEILKLGAVYWVARGHVVSGAAALLALHGASLLATERVFAVVKPQLLTIAWFAALWGRVEAIRDTLLRWVGGTRVGAKLRAGLHRLRASVRRAGQWIRTEARRIAG